MICQIPAGYRCCPLQAAAQMYFIVYAACHLIEFRSLQGQVDNGDNKETIEGKGDSPEEGEKINKCCYIPKSHSMTRNEV